MVAVLTILETWIADGLTDPREITRKHNRRKYTFYMADEGKPYLLRTVYKGTGNRTTTSFGGFDEPLDIQPPKPDEALSTVGGG